MGNTPYSNAFLSHEVEDHLDSHLDMQEFCTVDRGLTGKPGTKRIINVYTATEGTENLGLGQGNTKTIMVSAVPKEYEILTAQNRFEYYDEEEDADPMMVVNGAALAADDMFNHINADIYGEFSKATLSHTADVPNFSAFVSTVALLNLEEAQKIKLFGFVNAADHAAVQEALKDDLKYVESVVRSGYIGTVAGVHLYLKKNATKGEIVIGSKEAVTLFVKKGVHVEHTCRQLNNRSAEDANIRKNTLFTRKNYIAALTNATRAAKLRISPST